MVSGEASDKVPDEASSEDSDRNFMRDFAPAATNSSSIARAKGGWCYWPG
jgi:hypothetical protein